MLSVCLVLKPDTFVASGSTPRSLYPMGDIIYALVITYNVHSAGTFGIRPKANSTFAGPHDFMLCPPPTPFSHFSLIPGARVVVAVALAGDNMNSQRVRILHSRAFEGGFVRFMFMNNQPPHAACIAPDVVRSDFPLDKSLPKITRKLLFNNLYQRAFYNHKIKPN